MVALVGHHCMKSASCMGKAFFSYHVGIPLAFGHIIMHASTPDLSQWIFVARTIQLFVIHNCNIMAAHDYMDCLHQ